MNSSLIAIIAVITAIILSVIICDVRETRRLKKEEEEEEAEERARQRKEAEAKAKAKAKAKANYGNACTHSPIENVSVSTCCYLSCRVYGGCL